MAWTQMVRGAVTHAMGRNRGGLPQLAVPGRDVHTKVDDRLTAIEMRTMFASELARANVVMGAVGG